MRCFLPGSRDVCPTAVIQLSLFWALLNKSIFVSSLFKFICNVTIKHTSNYIHIISYPCIYMCVHKVKIENTAYVCMHILKELSELFGKLAFYIHLGIFILFLNFVANKTEWY